MIDLAALSIDLIRTNQAPSGAYVASPTFATYHYSWFRDGTYIAYALDLVGEHTSAQRFYDWAATMVNLRADAIARTISAASHGQIAPSDVLHTRYTLDGTAGTDDWPNFQLDGFGTLLWGMGEHLRQQPQAVPSSWRTAMTLLAHYLGALWRLPCYDCWEEFGEDVHTATLAAVYGGLVSAAMVLDDANAETIATDIKAFVLHHCIIDGCLVKCIGNPIVDASLIHVATPYRLLEPGDPVMQTTIARIEADLRHDGAGVHRYVGDEYYGGGEWVLLTAYLGWHYVERGELAQAHALYSWVAAQADVHGNLPEQVAAHLNYPALLPIWNARWGTSACPLLWSHAAYLTLHTYLGRGNDSSTR